MDEIRAIRRDLRAGDIRSALGRLDAITDLHHKQTDEQERRLKTKNLFNEWLRLPTKDRPAFWEWSHGKRLCS